jgi:ferritin-like metal-binding protein YciE
MRLGATLILEASFTKRRNPTGGAGIAPVSGGKARYKRDRAADRDTIRSRQMKIQTLSDLMIDQARELFDVEKQLVRALPKMAKWASSPGLREAFDKHLDESKLQAQRLEEVLEKLGQPIRARKCRVIQDLIEESKDVMDFEAPADVKDAALIAVARKIEHYEIAGYEVLRAWAAGLGESQIHQLLGDSLEEEKRTDDALAELAENGVNTQAVAM